MSNLKDFVIEKGVLKEYVGNGGSVVIPDTVKQIGSHAFGLFRTDISEIIIPATVKKINACSLPMETIIIAQMGSAGEIYAKKHNQPFVAMDNSVLDNAATTKSHKKMSDPQKELEDAILDRNAQRTFEIIEKHKIFELPSRALGLACRTGQLDIVKLLVKNKFNFTYKTTDKSLNSKYSLCYKPSSYKYHADFSLLLVVNDIWDRYLFGHMEKSFPPEDLQIKWVNNTERIVSEIPKLMALGSSKDRAEVIKFLYSKKKISDVKCNLLLYYAILENDTEIIEALDSLGAVVNVPWLDTSKYDSSYVSEYNRFLAALSKKTNEGQKHIFTNLNKFMRRSGQKFNVRESLFDAVNCYRDSELAKLVLENADTKAINKKKIMKSMICSDVNVDALIEFIKAGFADSKLLCELIELARGLGFTELQMAIMNYKNEMDNSNS